MLSYEESRHVYTNSFPAFPRTDHSFEYYPMKKTKTVLPKLASQPDSTAQPASNQRSAFVNQSRIVAVKRRRNKFDKSGRTVGSQSLGLLRARTTILKCLAKRTKSSVLKGLEVAQSFSYAKFKAFASPKKEVPRPRHPKHWTIVAKLPRAPAALSQQNSIV